MIMVSFRGLWVDYMHLRTEFFPKTPTGGQWFDGSHYAAQAGAEMK